MPAKVSKVRKTKMSGCVAVGFFGIFALAGGAAFYFLSWLPLSNVIAARGWTARNCEVVSSQVAENRDSDGSTYRVDIRYRYQVEWETYEGDRYNFSVGSSSGYDSKRKAVDAHPPGSETTCYVDPDDPTRSVINREPGSYLWWGLFPLPFLAVGVGGLVFLLVGHGRRRTGSDSKAGVASSRISSRGSPRRGSPKDRTPRSAADLAGTAGPLELDPGISPLGKIIGTLFIAALWNGMVSIFLFQDVIPGFRSGDIPWFSTLFMTPFVLVGVGLICFFLYQVLAWFNPRPRLTLADGHLTPGGETSLRWQFRGRAGRLQKLTIELEGRESARYRRGTSTTTDHHVFFSTELVSETRFHSIHRGEALFCLPERTMPSFKSSNHEIEWRLKVRGEIPFWPDVTDDFDITVHPR
ncbi:MAG: DUF3592 domain-containing protein [Thermoanaerobaculia bacterium]